MNLSLGIGGMLAAVAGISFLLIMVMTAITGKKAACVEEAIKGMEASPPPLKLPYDRTLVALIPPSVFILGILILTFIFFNVLQGTSLKSP
jgi:hypothetical protein